MIFDTEVLMSGPHCLCSPIVVTLLLLWPAAVMAQETATVIGIVVDDQKSFVPGATIAIKNVDTGFTRTAVTDTQGRYRLAAIPPGNYEFTAELQGFRTSVLRGVTLTVGSEAVINFTLSVASVAEEVTVRGDVPVVETTTSAVQGTMQRAQLETLPLAGRDYSSILRLLPTAVANNASYSFGGSRGRSNTFVVDGMSNTQEINGYENQTPPLDSIQEVQVLVNGFKAEYGQASGGVVNVISRTGTNTFSGSGHFLVQNNSLRARDPFANPSQPQDPYRRLQYGGTLGGPIKKDKLHYFVTYQGEHTDTASITTSTLPSLVQINAASAATRTFLSTNNIDISRFGDGGNQRLVRPEGTYISRLSVRLDNQTSSTKSWTISYMGISSDQPSGQSGTLYDYNGSETYLRTDYGTFNHKWIVSPNKLNEAYIQFGHLNGKINADYTTFPTVSVSGAFTLGSGTSNNPNRSTPLTVSDNFSWTLSGTRTGEHVVKMGGQVKLLKSDSIFDSNWRGTYTFTNLQAFLNGTPSRFTQNQGDSSLQRPDQTYAFFIQDDWRPARNLTLNVGLRYDYDAAKTWALVPRDGKPGPGISQDKDNFSPRFGFAWSPSADTKQVIYGGTGIYYDRTILNILGNARFTPPKVIGIQIDNPAWPDAFLGGKVTIPAPSLSTIDPNLVEPYNWNSQLGYRRELATNIGLDVSFIYNRGYDAVGIINTNSGIPGTASSTGANAVRPDSTIVTNSFYTNYGRMDYKALVVDIRKRFSRGFQAGVVYTLSKAEDNAFSFASSIQVPSQPGLSWGPDDGDQRHRVVAHAEFNLPRGFNLGTIVEFRSAAPLNIVANGRDLNGDGITGDWVNEALCIQRTGVAACPGFFYSRNSVRELSTADANVLRALFGLAPIASYGENPKYFNVDMMLQKKVRLGRHTVGVAAQLYNAFNIHQLNQPGTSILSNLFGSSTSVRQPRAVEVTLSYGF